MSPARPAHNRGLSVALSLCFLYALCSGTARAASPPADQGAVPTVSLLTFGPGDQAFAKFGHNALLVHDPSRPPESRDLVFNYGTFSFDSPLLVLNFLKGDLRYWLSVSTLSRTVAGYRAVNRSVFAKQLALTPAQAQGIVGLLHENAKPENRYYRYDYYRDNCSTRVRDLLDKTLGGALERASRTSTAYSYRDHTRRLTRDSPLLFFGLDLAMGLYIDHPITEWEAMFLPMEVDGQIDEARDRSRGTACAPGEKSGRALPRHSPGASRDDVGAHLAVVARRPRAGGRVLHPGANAQPLGTPGVCRQHGAGWFHRGRCRDAPDRTLGLHRSPGDLLESEHPIVPGMGLGSAGLRLGSGAHATQVLATFAALVRRHGALCAACFGDPGRIALESAQRTCARSARALLDRRRTRRLGASRSSSHRPAHCEAAGGLRHVLAGGGNEEDGLDPDAIQRAAHSAPAAVQDMGVDHGRRDVLVTQQLLYRSDVIAGSQEMGREAMAQRVTTCGLRNAGFPDGLFDRPLEGLLVEVMAAH